jgi:4-amino-4-deoxy-L-arabinose transferase-like glycosyltransferase
MSAENGPVEAPVRKPRVHVRPSEDYDPSSTTPSFAVDYADRVAAERREKLRKNPLVPAGALLTAAVLGGGLFAFNSGNSLWSQRLMRARILAQGATLGVLSLSVYQLRADSAKEQDAQVAK